MNPWMGAYWAACLQATLLSGATAVTYLATVRRRPRIAATALRSGLVLLLAISVFAALPLPAEWQCLSAIDRLTDVQNPHPHAAPSDTNRPHLVEAPEAGFQLNSLAAPLRTLLANTSEAAIGDSSSRASEFDWRMLLAIGVLCGIVFSVVRLVWGCWRARGLIRRSRVLDEHRLNSLRDALSERLFVRVACEFRESDDIAFAAICGWRRPTLLLAADWRRWSDDELRAAIAHELAHLVRRDGLLALLASIATAIHFYHPLVWWLRRNLAATHEIVADQIAAACFDRRDTYLLAVTRLALRHDRRAAPSGMLSFFGSFTSLLRRLEMLQDKEVQRRARGGTPARVLVVVMLIVTAIAASSLRMSAVGDEPPIKQLRRTEQPAASADRNDARPPIDLTYLNPENQGYWSMRPVTIFSREELRSLTELLDRPINDWLHAHGVAADLRVSIADVEQASGPMLVKVLDRNAPPGQRGQVIFGIDMLHTTRPYRWSELLHPLSSATTETEHGGMRLIEWSENVTPILGPSKSHVAADDRTLLPAWNAESIDRFRSRANAEPAAGDAALEACWRDVEQCAWAALFDNRTGLWTEAQGAAAEELQLGRLLENCRFAAVGVDWRSDTLVVQATGECKSIESAEALANELARMLQTSQDDARQQLRMFESATDPASAQRAEGIRVAIELCENAEITRDSRRLRLTTTAPFSRQLVVTLFTTELIGAGVAGHVD